MCSSAGNACDTNTVLHDRQKQRDAMTAGARCPISNCGALVFAYRAHPRTERNDANPWVFMCPRCELVFTAMKADLVFQAAPRGWFFGEHP